MFKRKKLKREILFLNDVINANLSAYNLIENKRKHCKTFFKVQQIHRTAQLQAELELNKK